jgi:hypothetical protein
MSHWSLSPAWYMNFKPAFTFNRLFEDPTTSLETLMEEDSFPV